MKNTGVARQGFDNDKPPAIIKRLKRLYGTPSLQDLDQALLHLHNPMDCKKPVEVVLLTAEKFQMFLIAHPYGDCELIDVDIIRYAAIKLLKCGGLYTKSI